MRRRRGSFHAESPLALDALSIDCLTELLNEAVAYHKKVSEYDEKHARYNTAHAHAESHVAPLREHLAAIKRQYDDRLKNLSEYEVWFFSLRDTFEVNLPQLEFSPYQATRRGLGRRVKLRSEARPIVNRLDESIALYIAVEYDIETTRRKILPEYPRQPESSHVKIKHNRKDVWIDLKKATPKRIRSAIERIHKTEGVTAKAAALEGGQRQVARTIKRKIKKQLDTLSICPYCERDMSLATAHADHIYPLSKGGLSTVKNMVFICTNCNVKKRDLTLRNFLMQRGLKEMTVYRNLELLEKDF